ncbi:MarR family winged helix-turn-helix transcriptional regulator [Phycicoccus flavus]|uniref:MarR family winged helix-turn-helix transcriptional regulator n=1 Tax=Phycicoccus flavus TaxID=2502783 RepID=UPI00197B844E|nr:MarR family winged helix-turn-helix transcriptional regulator [Phycicoccus flavus]
MPSGRSPHTTDERLLRAYRSLIADVHELAHVTQRISDSEARAVGATASQWHVLSVLSVGPRTVPSVARRLGLSRQAVQRTVDDLVLHGLLVLRPNPEHRTSPLLEITGAGTRLQALLYSSSDAARLDVIAQASLSPEELESAFAVVRRLLDAMAPHSQRDPE